MAEQDLDSWLAHFGVKGMKWGKRKSESSGGSSEPGRVKKLATKIALNSTEAQRKAHEDALTGKGAIGVLAKADKYTWGGKGRFEKYHVNAMKDLENSKKDIESGKLIVRTLLLGPQYSKGSTAQDLGPTPAATTADRVAREVAAAKRRREAAKN